MNKKERRKAILKDAALNAFIVLSSLRYFTRDVFSQTPLMIINASLLILLIIVVISTLIPLIFSTRIKEQPPTVLVGKKKWLLDLTKGIETRITNLFFLVFTVAIIYSFFDDVPPVINYIYWIFFGAHFGGNITRYCKLYQAKYAPKEEVPTTKIKNKKRPIRL